VKTGQSTRKIVNWIGKMLQNAVYFNKLFQQALFFLQNSQTVEPFAYKWVVGDLTIILVKQEVFAFVFYLLIK